MNPVERGRKMKQFGTLIEMISGLAKELGFTADGKKAKVPVEGKKKGRKAVPQA